MRNALFALALLGCNGPGIVVGSLDDTITLKAHPNRALDILFVIDDSPSMIDEQAALGAAFPQIIDRLGQLDGGLPNLHIGVVTSDMGTSAVGHEPGPPVGATCAGVGRDGAMTLGATEPLVTSDGLPFIRDITLVNGAHDVNYAGSLRDAFARIASVGSEGCGFEQHLAAMSRAFDNTANAGFLRADANLAVVIVADEDDCSAIDPALFGPSSAALGTQQSFRCARFGLVCDEDLSQPGVKTNCAPDESSPYVSGIATWVDRLIELKGGDARNVMVAAITGDPAPLAVELRAPPGSGVVEPALVGACGNAADPNTQWTDPAVRLAAFADGFPGRGTWTSLCNGDLSNALADIGSSAKQLMGDPCLASDRLADADRTKPGLQPLCEVIDLRDSQPDAPTSLSACADDASNCYEILPDAAACPNTADHLRVRFHRQTAVALDTWTYVRCKSVE